MVKPITQHSGSKYLRTIRAADGTGSVRADVYAVLKAFAVECPAVQHVVKKLLCAGLRGKGDRIKDLKEAIDALSRAVEMAEDDEGGRVQAEKPAETAPVEVVHPAMQIHESGAVCLMLPPPGTKAVCLSSRFVGVIDRVAIERRGCAWEHLYRLTTNRDGYSSGYWSHSISVDPSLIAAAEAKQ